MTDQARQTAQAIAEALLTAKAFTLRPDQPFVWASGWLSPIYCDNRLTLSLPQVRTLVKEGLVELIQRQFPQVACIAGVATAGIPQATLVADALQLPLLYVRPSPKDHGRGNQVEGRITPGAQVVVIEDLISTGGSSLRACEALKREGAMVAGMVSIFTYGFKTAYEAFNHAGLSIFSLTDYDTLLAVALEQGQFAPAHLESLRQWRQAPEQWGI